MPFFAALLSLLHTIDRLTVSSQISLDPLSTEIINCSKEELYDLSEIILHKLIEHFEWNITNYSSSERANALDVEIRNAIHKLEDIIETHVLDQLLFSQISEESIVGNETTHYRPPSLYFINLLDIKQDIQSLTKAAKKIMKKYLKELGKPSPNQEKKNRDEDVVSSRIASDGEPKMVGLSDKLEELKYKLTHFEGESLVVSGMAGIGKTTLAKKIFKDESIMKHFDRRAWITVGRNYSLEEILQDILAQVAPSGTKKARHSKASLKKNSKRRLKRGRYFIVLDDVWYDIVLEKVRGLLPKNNNGSKVLCTTRIHALVEGHIALNMRLMNELESWDLFCEKMFAKDQSCPLQLDVAGKKIVQRCEGLPLTIIIIANLLSKTEKIPEYWTEVATLKKHKVFLDAYDEVLKVLYPSYDFLPPFLKDHFLYLGVFPQNYEISASKLINLETADGSFVNIDTFEFLVNFNLVMPCQEGSSNFDFVSTYQIKTWRLHSSTWHLCNREARKDKFFHILDDRVDVSKEGIESQRRVCIHNNILFGIKDVNDSMEKNCASTARCLLCFGPYHRYPVPICSSLRLLRVLHAPSIRLYEFPIHVLTLILLRYLALTYDGKLPASIAKLCNLQFLIVGRHLSIKPYKGPLYLPMEIWYMKDLKHLQVMENDLPDPCGASLPNLVTLLGVSPHSCSKNVLEAVPNLKMLGIRIEFTPDIVESLSCFDHISSLHELESLKCVIVNPKYKPEVVAPLAPLSNLPSGLRKLTLSGMGYPWKEMSKIALLPNLEVLKLRCYAFRGPKWEVKERRFETLRFLLIQDTDLVQWKVGCESFGKLECLSIKHCYKLEEILGESKVFPKLIDLEMVDCNPISMSAVKEKAATLEKYTEAHFHVHSSWTDGN